MSSGGGGIEVLEDKRKRHIQVTLVCDGEMEYNYQFDFKITRSYWFSYSIQSPPRIKVEFQLQRTEQWIKLGTGAWKCRNLPLQEPSL